MARKLGVALGLVGTCVFGYLAARGVHYAELRRVLQSAQYWLVLPAFVVLALSIFLRGVRWRCMFRPEARPPFGAVMRALWIGYFFNNFLPARAGEAARVVALHRDAATSRAESAATVVLERVHDVVALLVLLFVALPWLPEVTWLRTAAALAVVLCAGLVVGVAVAKRYGHRPLRFALWPLARVSAMSVERLERATLNMARGLVAMSRPRVALVAFAWTTLSWLVMALSFWLVMIALGLHLPPVAGLFVVIAVGLGMVIPSSPAALGVFEAAAVVALLPYGVGKSLALSYALAVHAVNFVLYTAGGAAILPRYAIGFRRRSRAATATPSRVARGSARQLRKLGALSAMSRRSAKVAAPVQESTT